MANSITAAANRQEKWVKELIREWTRDFQFKSVMGKDSNKIFQVKQDLMKEAGDRLTFQFVRKLANAPITGDSSVEGSEEALKNFGDRLTIDARANAVLSAKMERKKTSIDYLEEGRSALKFWIMDQLRTDFLDMLGSQIITGDVKVANCTEAQRDAWAVANSDRLLYGAVKSNDSGDSSVDLAKVDNTNDKLTPAGLSLMKRIARAASPAIHPHRLKNGQEWYVVYAGSLPFRDLKENSTMTQANREARNRGVDNPIFEDSDLLWDGMIVKEIPEIAIIASTIDVGPVHLCGTQAIGLGYGQNVNFVVKKFDYDRKVGIMVDEIIGVKKLMDNEIQHGVVSGFWAAVADS